MLDILMKSTTLSGVPLDVLADVQDAIRRGVEDLPKLFAGKEAWRAFVVSFPNLVLKLMEMVTERGDEIASKPVVDFFEETSRTLGTRSRRWDLRLQHEIQHASLE